MAKQRNQPKKTAAKRAQQKASRPAIRLQEAEAALHANDLTKALIAASAAQRAGNDGQTQQRATELVVEIYFRQAATKPPWERLVLLDQAIQQAPHQARLHYHRGLTLWRMGQIDAATKALRAAAENDRQHPDLPFLHELGKVATGQPFNPQGFSPAECNTLTLLAQVQGGKADAKSVADQELLGEAEFWALLLQLSGSNSSVPVATFESVLANHPTLAGNPILHYAQGLLALRKGDSLAAQDVWSDLAERLATPWLVDNLRLSRRERATTLAQAADWQGVVALYEQARLDTKPDEMDGPFSEIAGHAYFQLGFNAAQAAQWPIAYGYFQAADALLKSRLLSQNLALAAEACEDWGQAATAWREMVRRRPRKTDHPDYLTDTQVAAIWQRAAHCYLRLTDSEEAITCLKNAVKYAPADLKARLDLVQLLMSEDRIDAAENEIDRILEQDGDYVPALVRKGFLSTNRWERDPMPIWKRVLTLEPTNEDARQALAQLYISIAEEPFLFQRYYSAHKRLDHKMAIQILQDGLAAVPRQPQLLLALGRRYQANSDKVAARTHFHQAIQLAPTDVQIIGVALHELLHVDGGDLVRELMPKARKIQGLRPAFWVSQGAQVLHCKLGDEWAEFFWQIAIELAQPMRGEDSPVAVLLLIWSAADAEASATLAARYAQQISSQHPKSGAPEYIDAVQKFTANQEKLGPVRAALNKAKANATKAGEVGVVRLAEAFEERISFQGLFSLFGGGPRVRGGGFNPFAALFGDADLDDDEFDLDLDDLGDDFFNAFR